MRTTLTWFVQQHSTKHVKTVVFVVVVQNFAYPADELMPLSCKGRVRGLDRSRGSVDEALGG